jgi:hypothetical protein
MAKGSGGTGSGKGGGTSRGQQLRDKFGNVDQAVNTRMNSRTQVGQKPSVALINTAKSAGTRAVVNSGRRSGSEVAATEKSIARRARKLGQAPKGGDATTRSGAQKAAQRKIRNQNAADERAISGKSNVKRAKRSGRVSPRRASQTGLQRNINI